MRSAVRVLIAASLPLLAACGSITDPVGPVAARGGKGSGKGHGGPPPPPAPPAHAPILFVHGWNASASRWTTMVSTRAAARSSWVA